MRPRSQAAKTPAPHAGNSSSILGEVTKNTYHMWYESIGGLSRRSTKWQLIQEPTDEERERMVVLISHWLLPHELVRMDTALPERRIGT